MGVTVGMAIKSKDTSSTKPFIMQNHMHRVSGVDHEQLAMLLQLMDQHPNELVDATLKNFVTTLKLVHSEPLAELVNEARRLSIQQEQHRKAQQQATKRRVESLEQDLASELDHNVQKLRALMHSTMGAMRQGISREKMNDPCSSKLMLFLCKRFDLELQSTLRFWKPTQKILRITDERFVELAREIDHIPHGILRDMIQKDRDLQTTSYGNKSRYLMEHVLRSDYSLGFTGSHDWGV